MRPLPTTIALLCALSGAAHAGAVAVPPDAPPPPHDFWSDVLDPHGAELAEILRLVHDGNALITSHLELGKDDASSHQKLLVEMRGMLRHAYVLSPDDPRVLGALAMVDDDLGLTDDARDLYRAALRAHADVPGLHARYGLLALHRGEPDALVHLVAATGPDAFDTTDNTSALLAVANLAARAGDVPAAEDLLSPRGRTDRGGGMLAAFALVVLYDRDEQLGKRDAALHAMRVQYESDFGNRVAQAIGLSRLPDPEDHFYYQALLYESEGALLEARTEWAHYASVPDAPWRDRALAHLHDLDARHR
ncbi:MAG TPA: hypothetical protein VGM88_35115 [Kofleriaceae bacterium]|jgi:hypothetical protein